MRTGALLDDVRSEIVGRLTQRAVTLEHLEAASISAHQRYRGVHLGAHYDEIDGPMAPSLLLEVERVCVQPLSSSLIGDIFL